MNTTKQEELKTLMTHTRKLERELADLRQKMASLSLSQGEQEAVLKALPEELPTLNEPAEQPDPTLMPGDELLPLSSPSEVKKEEELTPLPPIILTALSLQDPLRVKWKLGMGMPTLSRMPEDERMRLMAGNHSFVVPHAQLRLFGLLASGEPWQCLVPFETIAQEGGVTIGRDPAVSQIVLQEDGVSRTHALLEVTSQGLAITDAGSTNGIVINERQLETYDRQTPLRDGMTLGLGTITLRVEIL